MRIEELVLEGFKSYPVRTQITGWDSSFNAITGLNGSGKSNILDAICFVLGITNMSSMRAQNQQDLIYKRGQAGITKASVTIVFDNSDREKSPVGLENCKQITVTRQIALPNVSKYLLNGHKSQQHTIQTLFQGVQLNINNPNFLIMQGRITKVLNMRPQEILGMVEEAAGTRMFEERKDKAKKTMGKKEKRVDEITSLLAEEIIPKLDTLRAEKRSFLQWQKACSELERIGRLLRAWEWTEARERVARKEADIVKKEGDVTKTKKEKERYNRECGAAEKACDEVKAKREEEMRKGGKFKKREEEVAELEKALVKMRTQADIKKGTIEEEEKKVKGLEDEAQELERSLGTKRVQVDELNASFAIVKEKHTETQTTLNNAEELLQTLLTGLSSSSTTTGGGYMGQLADAKARLAQAVAEEEQSRVKLGMAEKELKALEVRWKDVEREAGEGKRNLEAMKRELENLRKKVEQSGWNAERDDEADLALRKAKAATRDLTDERDATKQRLSALDFSYTPPSPNFDRSKVKGLVASLIHLDAKDYNKSTALEITAGGKLYNVVVEDEKIGKDLLQNGKLKKRVTIIPLNKINAFKMSAQKLQSATRIGQGKVRLALSLIGYPDEVSNAMSFVFGDTFICDDAESAKLVTFSKEVGVKSVTLDGDVYDPSGTLSGGAAPSGSGMLIKVQALQDVERRLREATQQLESLERDAEKNRGRRDQWKKLASELEIKAHEVGLLEEQVEGSNAARVGADIESAKKKIVDLKAAIEGAKDKQRATKEECKKLEKDMDEFKNNKEGKIDELKASISKQKIALQKQAVLVKTQQKDMQTAALELEQIEKDIEASKAGVKDAQANVENLRKELKKLLKDVEKNEQSHAEALRKLQEERATLTRFDNELKDLEAVIKDKKQAISDSELHLKKLEHDLQSLAKDKTAAQNFVTNLEKANDWISEEKQYFGKAGSPYDFAATDMPQIKEKARELEEQQKGMKKKVNPKVLNMIDSVEKKEAALKKMLSTVLKDKEKIEETIEELDRYKRDALQKTWEKVNNDFGGIFAELLPGNFAKLQPPEGQDLTQGLEVKVQLGSVWKQSLTELSGGQRSLIALSLIMSLLQFKPAPMYILDEIDAALDLSHTQHIGHLFRTRFKGSQFIVVSLKEGLFTNANVLFRTRFRDGTSIVERTAQRSTSTLYDSPDKENEDVGRAPRRRGGAGK
ncbi:condensin complex subunit SMC2 [Rickenella mellea]|uniref:Structural maintenance of chromosomes protein n=1 Tax=Rickenella mellea TaxID=50990 RepID=A0A4Y7Q757_9AGAM|nr:condensin complex subunit SMC2 [Rickenella mellea]